MFEFRSKIEEAEGKEDLLALMQSTSAAVDECTEQLDRYIQGKNTSKMTPVAVRLQYLYKVFHVSCITITQYTDFIVSYTYLKLSLAYLYD
jgi:hypothetical protein